MRTKANLANICPVFLSPDVRKTVQFYVEKLGFKYATHLDKIDSFATIYRDTIEIVVVQLTKGAVTPNSELYGKGYDTYINPKTVRDVDLLHEEFQKQNIQILKKPHLTDYGSREFSFKDCDGRIIGVGRIADKEKFFTESNFLDE
jgi:predicted enzyme related to lactoylglutathione lyase